MSIESAKAYIERLKTDEEFVGRVKAAADNEARLALVKAEGFDFSEEDISAIKTELSDAELEEVAAGGAMSNNCTIVGPFSGPIAFWSGFESSAGDNSRA